MIFVYLLWVVVTLGVWNDEVDKFENGGDGV